VTTLCHPALAAPRLLWGSAADPAHRLVVRAPRAALPFLVAAPPRTAAAVTAGEGGDEEQAAAAAAALSNGGAIAAAAASAGAAAASAGAAASDAAAAAVAAVAAASTALAAAQPATDAVLAEAEAGVEVATAAPAHFAWLPDPSLLHASLDAAISANGQCDLTAISANGGQYGGPALADASTTDTHAAAGATAAPASVVAEQSPPAPPPHQPWAGAPSYGVAPSLPPPSPPTARLALDCSLSVLARKLRMVGVDTAVVGQVLRSGGKPKQRELTNNGLLRVQIDSSRVEAHQRRGAIEGRLLVSPPRHPSSKRKDEQGLPGASYRLLAADADAQFAELLEVLGIREAVEAGGSRCGICNGAEWRTLCAGELRGQVPEAVRAEEGEFYQCGVCLQVFWPGAKYDATMDGLKQATLAEEANSESIPA